MDISHLEFGILSASDVLSISVCEVHHEKPKKITNVVSEENTLYDPRMGPVEDDKVCPTCKKTMFDCVGHFGHIVLNEHIIYPLPYGYKTVMNFLKCMCFQCSRLIYSKEKLELLGLSNLKDTKRTAAILDVCEKAEICWNCNSQIPKFFVVNSKIDPKIMMYYKLLTEKKSKETSVEVSIQEIERVFKGVLDEDIITFGFNPERMRPIDLILSIIPVMPPCSRPYVITNGEKCEDDLTTLYRDISKTNSRILAAASDEDRAKEIRSLSFYISTLMDNSKGRVKQPNGRAKKGIKERLSGKNGIPRGNLIGKRTDFSARTVVGGDPTLDADEFAIPKCISTRVTIPDMVTKHSLEKLSKLVNTGQAEFVFRPEPSGGTKKINLRIATASKPIAVFLGDVIKRSGTVMKIDDISLLRNGDVITRSTGEEVIVDLGKRKPFTLQLGDEVHRHLQDGDWVLLNRQPTLHVGSMLAGRVKVQPVRRTIGIPLNCTTPQNCDFDGKLVAINSRMP